MNRINRIPHLAGLTTLILAAGCFPHKLGPHLQHFDTQAPAVGDAAPELTLFDIDGNEIALGDMVSEKPLVLQFGSHSCPVYRYRRFGMEKLRKKYGDSVNFQIVYTLEAHPRGSNSPFVDREWVSWPNRLTRVTIPQTYTQSQRLMRARFSKSSLDIQIPMAIDGEQNSAWQAYGAAASPAFVIDPEGRIALRQVWIDPTGIDQTLQQLLSRPSQ